MLGIALNEMYSSSPHPMENIETLIWASAFIPDGLEKATQVVVTSLT